MAKLPIRNATKGSQTSKQAPQRVHRAPQIVQHLQDRAGQPVTVQELMDVTAAPNPTTVQNIVADLIRRKKLDIEVVVRGNVWRYVAQKPAPEKQARQQKQPKPSKPQMRTFEEVGTTSDGTIVAKHDDKLYTVQEM